MECLTYLPFDVFTDLKVGKGLKKNDKIRDEYSMYVCYVHTSSCLRKICLESSRLILVGGGTR